MRVPEAKSSGGSQEHPNLPRAWESSSGGESWLHDGLQQPAIPANGRSEMVIYSLLATEQLRLTELEGFYRPTCRWVNRNEPAFCPVGGGSCQSISGLERDEPLRWSAGGKALGRRSDDVICTTLTALLVARGQPCTARFDEGEDALSQGVRGMATLAWEFLARRP
jgi:hypothetical protein